MVPLPPVHSPPSVAYAHVPSCPLAQVSPEDEAALAAFMAPGADSYHQKTLADMVLEKIRERQAAAGVAELPR